jgi:predicted O-methyltransferase YrrM
MRSRISHLMRRVEARAASRGLAHAPADADAAFGYVQQYEWRHASIRMWQVKSEFLAFLSQVAEEKAQRVLEIGTGKGGSLFFFARVADDDATLVSVDLPGGNFGGGYPPEYASLFRSFRHANQQIQLISGDSHSHVTVDEVRRVLDGPADVLLIDGDHSYEGVRADFDFYRPLVREGGLIAFHDIVPGPEHAVGGVPRFWGEIKPSHGDINEIVESWEQGGYGIGVVRNYFPDRTST